MLKINRKIYRTIKFIIIMGSIIIIDKILDITTIFSETIQMMMNMVFGMNSINKEFITEKWQYLSLYASIALLLSSNISRSKKIEYSISTIIIYAWLYTFILAYNIENPSYTISPIILSLITIIIPILLWKLLQEFEE